MQVVGGIPGGITQALSAQDLVREAMAFHIDLDNPHHTLLGMDPSINPRTQWAKECIPDHRGGKREVKTMLSCIIVCGGVHCTYDH